MNEPSIVIDYLTKKYDVVVSNDPTPKKDKCEIFGLLGHKGADKTTTINILANAKENCEDVFIEDGIMMEEGI